MNARHLDGDEPHPDPWLTDDPERLSFREAIARSEASAAVRQAARDQLAWREAERQQQLEGRPAPKPRHPVVAGLWFGLGALAAFAAGSLAGLGLLAWLGVW